MTQRPQSMPVMTGLLERGVGGLYEARSDQDGQLYTLRARGIFRKQGRTPLVGDYVRFTPGWGEEEHGWLEELLPRRNEIKRPPVANVDQLCLVVAPEPQPDLLLVDRMLIWARHAELQPLILLNKEDLDRDMLQALSEQYQEAQVECLALSAKTGEGLEALRQRLDGKVSCFAGQSAVGKSSLLNALFDLDLAVGRVSRRTERGRHTTRQVQLLRQGDALLLDTPGFSLLELWPDLPPETLQEYYPEYAALAGDCRFAPCQHDTEPDCAVRRAVEGGGLNAQRYARYRTLLQQVREQWRGRYG